MSAQACGCDPEVQWICERHRDMTRVSCFDCPWRGRADELIAQACPLCDGRVAEEGSPEYAAHVAKALKVTHDQS